MKNYIIVFLIELLISAVVVFFSNNAVINYDFFTLVGLGNLIIGGLGGIIGLIGLAINKEQGKSLLIGSGLLLLSGCLTCTFFPMSLNGS